MVRGKAGFTLIELLVVIAIIAILAAILFPIFVSVKARAKTAACLSNQKQIGAATSMYMDDNGGRFPMWGGGNVSDGWLGVVQKYAKTKLMAKCPGMPNSNTAAGFGYWRNCYTDRWSAPERGNNWPPPTMSEMIYPKSTVFLMCGPAYANEVGWHTWWGPPTTWPSIPKNLEEEAESRHGGGANVLFVDGHVALVIKGGFKSTLVGTGADNPLKQNPVAIANSYQPKSPWDNRNDGSHPWFRND